MLFMSIGVQLYTSIKTAQQIKELRQENKELKDVLSKLYRDIEATSKRVDKALESNDVKIDVKFNQSTAALRRFQEEIFDRISYLAKKTQQQY